MFKHTQFIFLAVAYLAASSLFGVPITKAETGESINSGYTVAQASSTSDKASSYFELKERQESTANALKKQAVINEIVSGREKSQQELDQISCEDYESLGDLSFEDWKKFKEAGIDVEKLNDKCRGEIEDNILSETADNEQATYPEYPSLSPQIQAQNQILDEFIKMFITGLFLALLAGFVGLISLAYAKATGKRAEVERDEKSNIEVASRMRRMANFSIDCLILINGISALIAYSAISFEWYGLFEYSWFIWIGTILLYYIFFEGFFGRTPGKLVTRTKVIGKSGEKPNFGEVIARTLLRFVPFEIFSYMGKRALGWHDRWSGTMVIPTTPNESTDKVSVQKESTWHSRLTNIAIFLIAPIFWVVVFIADGGDIEEIPILLLVIALTGLAVWVVYKATLYVIYGSKK